MKILEKAIAIAKIAHDGQIDKAGVPYILHPLMVMTCVDTLIEKTVAVLHDVLEDSSLTVEDLRSHGFSEEVIHVLDILTHKQGEPYFDYIRRVSENPIARKVKIADLIHNMNLSRIKNPTENDFQRLKRYQKAILILLENND